MTARPSPIVAVALLGLGLAACQGCRSTGSSGSSPPPSAAAAPDVPTVRLVLLTDVAGALEPCGCTKDQLGGLDHFGAWIRRERERVPATRVAAAGPLFFMDDRLDPERADQDRIKAETMARVLRGVGLTAFAPGVNDWDDGATGLAKLANAAGATAIVPARAGSEPFGAFVVRDLGGVRVAFLGFGQGPSEEPERDIAPAVAGAVEAAKGAGANVLVALVSVGRGAAKRIADRVPELTAIVVGDARSRGDANTTAAQPEQVGDVLVVQAANHLQSVAVLDLYVRDTPTPGHVLRFADATGLELARKRADLSERIDELHARIAAWERDPNASPGDVQARRRELGDLERERGALDVRPPPANGSFFRYTLQEVRESLGKDPEIDGQLLSYYKAVDEHNRAAFADRMPVPAGKDEPSYVGVDVCAQCHADARAFWQGTPHAHAYATLTSQYKEFNLDCVGCHVTGYERPGGSTVTHVARLENVQCEVCHGPGSKHAADSLDTSSLVKPAPATCLACHSPPHVESFDPAEKMRLVVGPGHGQPKAK